MTTKASGEKWVFLLYSTAENNETTLEAVTTDREMDRRWNRHRGHHSEVRALDDLSEIRWALKDDEQ